MERLIIPSSLKLGVFDIDGTIKDKTGIPDDVKNGFIHLHERGVLTTLMTGRGYNRLLSALGNHKDHLISNNAPIGLENGGRIVTNIGDNLQRFPLSTDEIDDTLLLAEKYIPKFLFFYPVDTTQKAYMWSPREDLVETLSKKYSDFAEVSSENIGIVRQRIVEEKPAMLVLQFPEEVPLPSDLNAVAYEGVITINREGISKATGVTEIAQITNTALKDIFVAGNDENDRKMLELPVGLKILVGDELCGDLSFGSDIFRVSSPLALGKELQKF